jgi:hypothetical protein
MKKQPATSIMVWLAAGVAALAWLLAVQPTAGYAGLAGPSPTPSGTDAPTETPTPTETASPTPTETPTPTITPTAYFEFLPALFQLFNEQPVYGVEIYTINQSAKVLLMKDAGAYWVRKNGLYWAAVEPVQGGGYQWGNVTSLETQLKDAVTLDMHTILIVRNTPAWAQLHPGYPCGPMQSQYFDDFGAFMAAAVARYSQPPYNVMYYELWNEPDVDWQIITDPNEPYGCWGDSSDPYYGGGYYGEMLKVVYPMIKAANPRAQVLIGGLLMDCDPTNPPQGANCTPSKYLEGILLSGARNSFDAVSFHAYDYYNYALDTFGNPNWHSGRFNGENNGKHVPAFITKLNYIRTVLNAYGVVGKQIFNTEVALLCGGGNDPPGGPGCEPDDDSPYEIMKQAYLAQAYAAVYGERLDANIWFSLDGWRNSGLVNVDETPRPAYFAYAFSRAMLWNYITVTKNGSYANVTGYNFTRDDSTQIWVLWATNDKTVNITLPSVPLAIWDSDGDSVTVTGTSVSLTVEPFYIQMP